MGQSELGLLVPGLWIPAVDGASVGGAALLLLSSWNVHVIRLRLLEAFSSLMELLVKIWPTADRTPRSLISIIAVSPRRQLPALRRSAFFHPPLYPSHHPFNVSVSFLPPSLRLSFILRLLQRPDVLAGVLAGQIRARRPFLRLRSPRWESSSDRFTVLMGMSGPGLDRLLLWTEA